jgi:hypothetical protein
MRPDVSFLARLRWLAQFSETLAIAPSALGSAHRLAAKRRTPFSPRAHYKLSIWCWAPRYSRCPRPHELGELHDFSACLTGRYPLEPFQLVSHCRRRMHVPGLRGPRVRVSASGASRLPRHWKNESVRPWRLLGGPVCASLPNSSESIPRQCSASATLSPPQASSSDNRRGCEMSGCAEPSTCVLLCGPDP